MMKSKSMPLAVLAVTLIAISYLFSLVFVLPGYRDNKRAIVQTENEIAAAQNKLESLKNARTTIDSLGLIVDKIFVAVSGDNDVPNLITELEAIALSHNMYLPNIQVSDGENNKVAISFNATANNLADISGLIYSLENDLKFFNIKNISLSLTDGKYLASIQLEAYKFLDKSLAGAGASETTTPSDVLPPLSN